ncbi:hypothetical protein GCM10029964_029970 [Kibdelosporangium lantanae]
MSADKLNLTFEMSYDARPLGRICLCVIGAGTVEDHRVDGSRAVEAFGPGDVFSFALPDGPYSGRINQARYSITMFDPALLDQVAGGRVRLLDHRPVDHTAARQPPA